MQADSKYRRLTAPTDAEIARDVRGLGVRQAPSPGKRQVAFVPTEVLLCLAASRVVKWNRFGQRNIADAPTPVPELARLFKRPPSSITAKMGNLLGGWAHAGMGETEAAAWLLADPNRLQFVYEQVLRIATTNGVTAAQLPDFLPKNQSQWCPW